MSKQVKEEILGLKTDISYLWQMRNYQDVGTLTRNRIRAAIMELKKFRRISAYA